ncbi:peptidoglycan DD-metalloendopeptidase family protein [Ectobacillus polymachus]|uniref:peptidoglycan DD-metalloendopeptidase family protein n=1 Tax=Ectobacillus polymachus TaxID=1508806 RepID=UPI003A838ABC
MLVSFFFMPLPSKADTQWIWPVSGAVSDYFGTRSGHHYGIDIAATVGTPVVAASKGTVTKSYYSKSYGNVIFIRHTNGYEAVYAHLSKRFVSVGQHIHSGQKIGEVGNTGLSHGSHLHFEVHNGDWNIAKSNAVNPLQVLGIVPSEMVSSSSYFVQKGDTLSSIAVKYGMTVEELKIQNQLHTDIIYPSQQLIIHSKTDID